MVQFAWPAFTESRRDRHLVVVEVPRHVTEEPAPLLSLMLESLEPKGDFAMSSMKSAAATVLYCAFSSECDANLLVEALGGFEQNVHHGWASEHHCRLDQIMVHAIKDSDVPDKR